MATNASTSATWGTWVTTSCTGGNGITINSDGIWVNWCDSTTTTTATIPTNTSCTTGFTDDITWDVWTSGTVNIPINNEFREMVEREAEQRQAERLEHAKLQNERKAKAAKLLRGQLTRKQKKDFDKHKHFFVRGNVSGNLYKINRGRTHNVEMLDKFKNMKQRLCAHPGIYCPDEDTMLSQKIMLEHMEDHFREVANITYH